MIGKKPERPKGGWKIHEKQLQELWDWVNRERVLDGPGVQNTGNGKKITWRADDFSPMFRPYFNRESKYIIKMGIRTGYVYAPYDDGNSTHLPMLNRFRFEPKIGNSTLSSAPSPSLTLENSATNYIFLKLTWGSFSSAVGGFTHDSSHAFKIREQVTTASNTGYAGGHDHTGYTGYEDDHTHSSGGSAGDSHRHTITAESTHSHTIPALTVGTGYVKINKKTYYLTAAEFITQTSDTPPTETETVTNMLAGWIKLDANGDLDTATNDGSRWFIEGPVYADKNPIYITGKSSPDRTEPVAPVASSGETIPGE